ncbi:septum formation family protein [Nesterenkonia alba]|uniref:septum formation family protein n=1 Tax=Nesterenkonia alba TaxID=515814 RepID=UPI0003B69712|nr:septum formation family protein [Nesterenkonia alba]
MSEDETTSSAPEQPLTRRARREAEGDTGRRFNAIPFLIAGVLVVLLTGGLLWWFVLRETPTEETTDWTWTDTPADGVHARDVPSEDWEVGWCLSGYVDEDTPADVVDCERSYDAQVLLRQEFDEDEEDYPGDELVLDVAHQWCEDDIELSSEALAEVDYELHVEVWHPTQTTWRSEGDRMVSCFLTRPDGQTMSGDFLASDEDEDAETVETEDIDVENAEDAEDSDEPEDEDDDADDDTEDE